MFGTATVESYCAYRELIEYISVMIANVLHAVMMLRTPRCWWQGAAEVYTNKEKMPLDTGAKVASHHSKRMHACGVKVSCMRTILVVIFLLWCVGIMALTTWFQEKDPVTDAPDVAGNVTTPQSTAATHTDPRVLINDMSPGEVSSVCNKTHETNISADTAEITENNGIDPCKNMALYATWDWLQQARDGEDRSFSSMEHANAEMLFDIFEIERRREWGRGGVGILHQYMKACEAFHAVDTMSTARAQAAASLCSDAKDILKAANNTMMVRIMGRMSRAGAVLPFYFTVETERVVGRKPILYFEQDGLLASDRRAFVSTRAKATHLGDLKRILGVLKSVCGDELIIDENTLSAHAYSIEKELYDAHSHSAARDIIGYVLHVQEYEQDVLSMQEMSTLMGPSFSIAEFMEGFMPENTEWLQRAARTNVWLYRKSFFEHFAQMWVQRDVQHWRAYLLCALVASQMRYMPHFFPDTRDAIVREMQYAGTQQQMFQPLLRADTRKLHAVSGGGSRARSYATPWHNAKRIHKIVTSTPEQSVEHPDSTLSHMPECLWHTWQHVSPQVARWFAQVRAPDFVRVQIRTIVEDVRDAMIRMLRAASGLTTGNVEKQIRKLESVVIKIGTPNHGFPSKLDNIELSGTAFQQNAVVMDRWHRATQVNHLLEDTVSRDGPFVQSMSLTEANAFYNPQENCISVLAGLFLPPFYSPSYDNTRLLAGIGMVVGHELAHSVDYTGIYWNEHGSLDDRFASDGFVTESWRRTQCVRRQYTDVTRLGNTHDGTVTIAEDWSDIFGVKAALEVALKRANITDSLLDLQRRRKLVRVFFTHYAKNWMVAYTKESEASVIQNDVHSVAEVRINNVFANSARGLRAFGCRGEPVCPNIP